MIDVLLFVQAVSHAQEGTISHCLARSQHYNACHALKDSSSIQQDHPLVACAQLICIVMWARRCLVQLLSVTRSQPRKYALSSSRSHAIDH